MNLRRKRKASGTPGVPLAVTLKALLIPGSRPEAGRLARSGQRVTGGVLDVLGAVVDEVVLVPPAPIGEVVPGLAAVRPVIAPDPAGADVEPAGGVVEPIAGPAPPPIRATVCSSSVPV